MAEHPRRTDRFAAARGLADAVLYEGYVLYPYRATSPKNQVRFQWGVLMPADVVARDASERDTLRAGVVVEGRAGELTVQIRFLHVQRRAVQRATEDGFADAERLDTATTAHVPWDEAVEREVTITVPLVSTGSTTGDGSTTASFAQTIDVPGGEDFEDVHDDGRVVGRLVRTREPVRLGVQVTVARPPSPYGVVQVDVRLRNVTPATEQPGDTRPAWLRRALVAAHLLLGIDGGRFVSQLDPPEWAKGYVAECTNEGAFPVLANPGEDATVMLASPIILYDHAHVAPESASAFFDALEVDELLSLRTMTLSEEEKRGARGTDPRTAALLDEVDAIGPDLWDRLHGTVRYVDAMTAPPDRPVPEPASPETPWWDPGADSAVDPETDTIPIGGVEVGRGSRVVLRPGKRRADAFDMFLAGREATVAAVFHDVDSGRHLAVTIDDDPGADLKEAHGRYLYFAPDEVEPLRSRAGEPL